MTLTESDRNVLRVCSAILTNNRRELEWAVNLPATTMPEELFKEAREALELAPIPGEHGLVRLVNYLPAPIQYVGQRAILLFPRIARRLLRNSGLHHRMF